ncbi:MAG: nicotinamide mononucleotide transporter [Chitinophagales bacterium]|nr:nicotinamide mononucleotide transporter [Chitinophagales bacterium]
MDFFRHIVSDFQSFTILEIIAVVFALIYVILAWKEKIACWVFGIISSFIFMYISFKVNYKLEAFLYLFYVLMGFYGWYEWAKGLKKVEEKAVISTWNSKKHLLILIFGLISCIILAYIFDKYLNSSLPYLDAVTTVFAIIATWMTTRKILENWIYWIIIDVLSIYLYLHKDLYFASALYIIYVFIAAAGYYTWLNSYNRSKELLK